MPLILHPRLSALAGPLVALLLSPVAESAQAQASPEGVVVAEQRAVHSTVVIGGTVIPRRSVTLAAQLPGRVEYLAGEEGDVFGAGERLVALNSNELWAQRRAAQAELAKADAALRSAGVQYERELASPSVSSQTTGGMGIPSMFDQMLTNPMSQMMGTRRPGVERGADLHHRGIQVEQARSALQQATSRIQQIDAKLRDSLSLAPFDGVIVTKYIEVGDTVQPGQPMLDFANTVTLQVQADIPARLVRGLRVGMAVPVRLDVGDGAPVGARLARIFPIADPQRHTIRVKLDLAPGSGAAPGMYAEVMVPDIRGRALNTIVIPISAVVTRSGLDMVYVLDDANERDLRLVRLGDPIDHQWITVLSGLQAGDRVVVSPGAGQP